MAEPDRSEKKRIFTTTDTVYAALGAVLITVCGWISVYIGAVPVTMQTFGVFCVLSLFGGKRGCCAIILYIVLGMLGVPVFAGFMSGPGVILGSTGGYIIGFIFIGAVYSAAVRVFGKKLWVEISSFALGLLLLYTFGTLWYVFVHTASDKAVGVAAVLSQCVFPFIVPDIVKMSAALLCARRLSPILNKRERAKRA